MSDVSAQKVQTFSLFPSFRKSGCMEQTKVSTNVSSRDAKVSMRCETVTYKGRKQRELWQPTWSLFSAADGARGVVHGLWGVREAGSHCDKGNGINNGAEPQESAPFFHVNITGDIHAWLIPPHSHHMKCTNKWTRSHTAVIQGGIWWVPPLTVTLGKGDALGSLYAPLGWSSPLDDFNVHWTATPVSFLTPATQYKQKYLYKTLTERCVEDTGHKFLHL